ncbi:MAG: hypothetical protein EP334_04820 [Gammaproteobacteria bacterium]|nr:MAG: hypothetical protein EP334_04820 [Gammaproteobacteria bacterium]
MIVQRISQGNKWQHGVTRVTKKVDRTVRFWAACLTLVCGAGFASAFAGGMPAEDENRPISEEEAAQIIASPEAAAAGEGLFNQVCVYCHGAQGIGGKARKMQCRTYDSKYLFDTISNGKKRGAYVMPSWKRSYDEKTRWELVSYIMTLKDLEKCQ